MDKLINEIEKKIYTDHDFEFEQNLLDWIFEHYSISERVRIWSNSTEEREKIWKKIKKQK